MRQLEEAMLRLRRLARRADCIEMPTVTLEFDSRRDRAVFVMTLQRDMTIVDAANPNNVPGDGRFEFNGIKVFTRVKGDPPDA